ncbi:MAG: hypothetical protein WC334_02785 [Kiritimatiellales bacterium]|jgi:hypothetical protein
MTLKNRIAELTLGHTVNQTVNYLFDYGLYPLVIFWLGLGRGFVVMAGLSFLACWLQMRFYDWSKRDWLGIEAVKSLKNYAGESRAGHLLAWALRRSEPVACVLLSVYFDPFIVTAYFRRGSFGGMTRRDWRIFLLSWFIGNAWWSVACFTGISAVEWVWQAAKQLFQ